MIMEFNKIYKGLEKNEKWAWKMILENYSSRIYSYILNFSGSREFAEEGTQEVFFRMFKSIKKIKGKKEDFEKYLYTIAKNYSIDHYRKNKNINIIEDKDYLIPRWDPDFETKDLVWRGINQLEEEDRELIILREIEGYSYEEISNLLDIPMGTVKSRINRVRLKLAEIIKSLQGRKQ